MKKGMISIPMVFAAGCLIVLSPIYLAAKAKQKVQNGGADARPYSIEETTRLLGSSRLGSIRLDHDDHVYKCMRIAKLGKDLEGAVDALVEFKIDFGDTLDDEEVEIVIRASRVDTELLRQIAVEGRKIGKKEASIEELGNIIDVLEHGNGTAFLDGILLADDCNYKIENDYLNRQRIDLILNAGRVRDRERFLEIYDAMKKAGMSRKIGTRAFETLYKISCIEGDVADKILNYLKENKWSSRNQPGKREYVLIKDLMRGDLAAYYGATKKSAAGGVRKDSIKKTVSYAVDDECVRCNKK